MLKLELRTKRLIIKNISPSHFNLTHNLRIIGSIRSLNSIVNSMGEIGYIISEEKDRNKGFMTEALNEVLLWYPSSMRVLTINHDNKASQKVASRCGFIMQGYWNKQLQVWRHPTCQNILSL